MAYMFSGQGAQYPGMGKALYDAFPACRAVFERASAALGFSIEDVCFSGDGRLSETEYAQPAIFTASMAAYELVKGAKPDYALGLSLGEYAALAASGALDFAETVTLLRKRGRFMAESCPPGAGVMSAVMNLPREQVEACCREASAEGIVSPANYNMPGQIVIAGEPAAVAKAEELALASGAKRCLRLNVSGAFHTAIMAPAAGKLARELESVTIRPMNTPVLSNLTGDVVTVSADIPDILRKQVMSPVLWEDSVRRLLALGVDTFVELGPGKALCGFVKKIAAAFDFKDEDRDVRIYNIEDAESLEKTVSGLWGGVLPPPVAAD